MADNKLLPIPEGYTAVIPSSKGVTATDTNNLLPIPEGYVRVEGEEFDALRQAGAENIPFVGRQLGALKQGAEQALAERTAGLQMLKEDAKNFPSQIGDVLGFVAGSPTSLQERLSREQPREKLYQQYLQDRAGYEALKSIQPEELKKYFGLGEFGGNIAADLPIAAVTLQPEAAVGRVIMSGLSGAAQGATLPAESGAERFRNMELSGVAGGVLAGGVEALRPNINYINWKLRKSLGHPDFMNRFKLANALSKMTGINMDLAQATGSPEIRQLTTLAASGAPDQVVINRNTQLRQAMKYVNDTVAKLGDPNASPELVGNQLAGGLQAAKDQLVKSRNVGWDEFMDKAMAASGGRPIGIPVNTAQKLDDVLTELRDPINRYPDNVIREFESLRREVDRPWTVTDFKNGLKGWGRNAAGTGRIFQDLSTADSRRLYKEISDSLLNDLDAVQGKMGAESAAAGNLKLARQAWKSGTDQINDLEDTVLGSVLNRGGRPATPEELYAKVKNLPTSDLKKTIPVMDSVDPRIMDNVRARVMLDALDKAKFSEDPALALEKFSPATFWKSLKDHPNADLIFSSPKQNKEYLTAVNSIEKIASWAGTKAGGAENTLSNLAALGVPAAAGLTSPNLVFLSKFMVQHMTPERYVKLLMTPEGRAAVTTLSRGGKVSRKAMNSAAGAIVAIMSSPSSLDVDQTQQEVTE